MLLDPERRLPRLRLMLRSVKAAARSWKSCARPWADGCVDGAGAQPLLHDAAWCADARGTGSSPAILVAAHPRPFYYGPPDARGPLAAMALTVMLLMGAARTWASRILSSRSAGP